MGFAGLGRWKFDNVIKSTKSNDKIIKMMDDKWPPGPRA